VCESAKSTAPYLKRIGASTTRCAVPLQTMVNCTELPREVHRRATTRVSPSATPVAAARPCRGANVGLLSEAGMPAVADPGSSVVRAAHDHGECAVVPLVEPGCPLLLALGRQRPQRRKLRLCRLPARRTSRRDNQRIRELEAIALKTGQDPVCSSRRPIATWHCSRPCCKPCNTTRVWQRQAV